MDSEAYAYQQQCLMEMAAKNEGYSVYEGGPEVNAYSGTSYITSISGTDDYRVFWAGVKRVGAETHIAFWVRIVSLESTQVVIQWISSDKPLCTTE